MRRGLRPHKPTFISQVGTGEPLRRGRQSWGDSGCLGFLVRVRCSCVLRTPASEGIQRSWSAGPPQCVSRGLPGQKGELHLAACRALSSPFAGLQEARQCAHYCALIATPAIKNQETLESRSQANSGGLAGRVRQASWTTLETWGPCPLDRDPPRFWEVFFEKNNIKLYYFCIFYKYICPRVPIARMPPSASEGMAQGKHVKLELLNCEGNCPQPEGQDP